MAKNKSYTTITMNLMTQLKAGESFFTELEQTKVTAYAKSYGAKVTTEQCVLIQDYKSNTPTLTKLTKVTIL